MGKHLEQLAEKKAQERKQLRGIFPLSLACKECTEKVILT